MKIKVNTFEWQKGKLGKEFRLSSIYRLKENWYYSFKYLLDSKFFTIFFDNNGNFLGKLDHEETQSLFIDEN
jgi:hypothetical protein